MMNFLLDAVLAAWHLLLDSSIYILIGLLLGGVLRVFLSPHSVAEHMGKGRFTSVLKAAILGVPLPLCSCGVLPAAVSLKKQGANNGATTAFLISTPESGVDSISITYALLDPIMTVVRPVSAFLMATAAGILENLSSFRKNSGAIESDLSCQVDGCCDGVDCPAGVHKHHHSFAEKMVSGFKYAFTDIWSDLAGWFFVGLMLAGLITSLIPEHLVEQYLGGGPMSMLLMLVIGIPIYICATASTPVAAALILKGVSPGAALVFLLAGPATNITSLTVLTGVLGKRAAAIYLGTIAVFSVLFGLTVDKLYSFLEISPRAVVGSAAEVIPPWMQMMGTVVLLFISAKPLYRILEGRLRGLVDRLRAGTKKGASESAMLGSKTLPLPCAGST